MAWPHGPLEDDFPLQITGKFHFYVSELECIFVAQRGTVEGVLSTDDPTPEVLHSTEPSHDMFFDLPFSNHQATKSYKATVRRISS